MEFNYTPEQEQFRTRLKEWLESASREVFGDRRGAFAFDNAAWPTLILTFGPPSWVFMVSVPWLIFDP